jgi:hypothetical protein
MIVRFARTMRCAIVAGSERNAAAISRTLNAPTVLSVSATARVPWKLRMATHENHGELVVAEGIIRIALRDLGGNCKDRLELFAEHGVAPDDVERPVPRDREEPAARILGDAAEGPGLQRLHECILHHFFGKIEMVGPEHAREGGHHLSRTFAEQMVDERALLAHQRPMSSISRISRLPKFRCG